MSLKVLMLGDLMLGENHYHYGRGIRTHYEGRYDEIIDTNVKKLLFEDIDLLLFNLEYSLVRPDFEFEDIKASLYRAKDDSLNLFPEHVIKLANVANNHFSQHGHESARFTKSVLREKNILMTGETKDALIFKLNGETVKVWSVSLIPDDRYCGEYFLSNYHDLPEQLQGFDKQQDEYWVISVHWGVEYSTNPSKKQINLVKQLVRQGFDLVIGHHPHVIQPIARYGKSLVIFSLGNFISDQNFSKRTQMGLAIKYDLKNQNDLICFVTQQKKFFVESAKKIGPPLLNQPIKDSRLGYCLTNQAMRVMMKVEFLLRWQEVDKQSIIFLLSKFFTKFFKVIKARNLINKMTSKH